MHLSQDRTFGAGSPPTRLQDFEDEPKAQPSVTENPGSVEKVAAPLQQRNVSKAAGVTVIATLAGVSFLNTMGSGILIAALPTMAHDVGLAQGLMLWPASVYALAAGALLLIFGAAADVVGAKLMWVTGSFLFIAFTLAIGFAKTGIQLILFRTFQGIAIAMCLPTAVSLITNTFPRGTWRNTAFAMNGMGQPLGYSLGLVLGGVFTSTIGWRWAYYLMTIINFFLSITSIWSLPSVQHPSEKRWTVRLAQDIDWVGAIIMSVGLALLFYVLAAVSTSYISLGYAQNIALLVISLVLLASFPLWMQWQTKHSRPALIPNKLWRNASFTTICASVFLCWASLNAIEYYITLYFQEVEGVSALQSSLRFLPHPIAGTATNITTAFLISRVNVRTLAVVSGVITMIAPILMATVRIGELYWTAPFFALLLSPLNPDVLFTVSNLVISDAFAPEVQSLAGGVFNEVAQFGNAVGLAVTAAIASSVTDHSKETDQIVALMDGYRAAFWTIFAATALVVVIAFFGLRTSGLAGKKDD
ncbi:major facilitator superfamily domain-containing protein [Xylaria venustula]|nr:major facilitator superfamily domain-containing protein [Xylaria venustula]